MTGFQASSWLAEDRRFNPNLGFWFVVVDQILEARA